MYRTVIVEERQTLWDLAIQEHGSVEALFNVVFDNIAVINTANKLPKPGSKIKVISAPINRDVLDYYQKNNLRPVSGVPKGPVVPPPPIDGDYNIDFNDDFFIG